MKKTMVIAALVWAVACTRVWAGAYEDFFIAIHQDNPTAIAGLIERGLDPNTLDPSGQHGLLLALRLKSQKVAQYLARVYGTDVEVRTAQDESPLMLAALRGYMDVSVALLEREADVNKPGWTPLHYAATGGHVELIQCLLDNHAYIDAASPNGSTPLMMAAMYGTTESVKILLDAGADAAIQNDLGLTALDFAKRGNKPDSAELIAVHVRKIVTGGTW
jgi:ankyrin repeat protein